MVNWEPSPNVSNITKKRMDHSGESGKRATASGYATKANPAPVVMYSGVQWMHKIIIKDSLIKHTHTQKKSYRLWIFYLFYLFSFYKCDDCVKQFANESYSSPVTGNFF